MYEAFEFTAAQGIQKAFDYPSLYSQHKNANCKTPSNPATFKNRSQVERDNMTNDEMKAVLQHQPFGAAIFIPFRLKAYHSGIVTEDEFQCSDVQNEVNHGVVVVGYGVTDSDADGCAEYWIVRNSWGRNWGQEGFFNLCMDGAGSAKTPNGTCQINSFGTWPLL